MDTLRVLGIDEALVRSGWAVTDDGETIAASGVFTAKGKTDADRVAHLINLVAEIVSEYRPTVVYVEDHARTANIPNRSRLTIAKLAIAKVACELAVRSYASGRCESMPVHEWRQRFCGSRLAGKEAVQQMLRCRGVVIPAQIEKDSAWADCCDAMGLALAAWTKERLGAELAKQEQPAVKRRVRRLQPV